MVVDEMTGTDIKALVERLREVKTTDHERLCQGREYTCSCGYDDRIWAAASEAADALEACQAENEGLRMMNLPSGYKQLSDAMVLMRARAEKAEAALQKAMIGERGQK
jgi:hypothetical protein